jgi:U3 small nucleolar RNA-associated protein 15
VHVTKFAADGHHVFSGSDDKTVRLWDMAHEAEVACFEGHTDYVRCGAVSAVAPHLFLSGGYDHAVHLWDSRVGKSVLNVDHGAPVEAVLFFPSGSSFAAAGGNAVKIFETLGRTAPLITLTNHQKTVTSGSRGRGQH